MYYIQYSQVSNKRACSFINFQHYALCAHFYSSLLVYHFLDFAPSARLFHPAWLLLFHQISISTPCSFILIKFIVLLDTSLINLPCSFSKINPPGSFVPSCLINNFQRIFHPRAVARSEIPGGLVVLGGDNVSPQVEIGLTDLLKPPLPPCLRRPCIYDVLWIMIFIWMS